jgi:hypothetical protein
MVQDWSHRHVIFSEEVPRDLQGAMLAEPRFWHQYLRRHATRPLPSLDEERDQDGRERDREKGAEKTQTTTIGDAERQ